MQASVTAKSSGSALECELRAAAHYHILRCVMSTRHRQSPKRLAEDSASKLELEMRVKLGLSRVKLRHSRWDSRPRDRIRGWRDMHTLLIRAIGSAHNDSKQKDTSYACLRDMLEHQKPRLPIRHVSRHLFLPLVRSRND